MTGQLLLSVYDKLVEVEGWDHPATAVVKPTSNLAEVEVEAVCQGVRMNFIGKMDTETGRWRFICRRLSVGKEYYTLERV